MIRSTNASLQGQHNQCDTVQDSSSGEVVENRDPLLSSRHDVPIEIAWKSPSWEHSTLPSVHGMVKRLEKPNRGKQWGDGREVKRQDVIRDVCDPLPSFSPFHPHVSRSSSLIYPSTKKSEAVPSLQLAPARSRRESLALFEIRGILHPRGYDLPWRNPRPSLVSGRDLIRPQETNPRPRESLSRRYSVAEIASARPSLCPGSFVRLSRGSEPVRVLPLTEGTVAETNEKREEGPREDRGVNGEREREVLCETKGGLDEKRQSDDVGRTTEESERRLRCEE